MSKPIFYIGQAVGCLMNGEGIIREIGDRVKVEFKEWKATYLMTGQYHHEVRPTLYPIEQYREIIANLPAPQPEPWKPKRGDFCWFGNKQYKNSMAVLARFEQIGDRGYMAKINGGLSCYDFCAPFIGELPDHLKEVQP